jgi:hypothetical protein
MNALRGTLVTDGSRDQILKHVIEWLLRDLGCPLYEVEWPDLGSLPKPPSDLPGRIGRALELYPCDILFVHRDAEEKSIQDRRVEILASLPVPPLPCVCVVPIRMTEAWFLFDEPAIRRAAGNPCGSDPLNLPRLREVENIPDPKRMLHNAIRTASGLNRRRRNKMEIGPAVRRVADNITDYSPLRKLSAFKRFEADLADVLAAVRRPMAPQ